MNEAVLGLLVVVGSYLIGSVPSAYLAGRWLKGIDIRRYGSGSVGGSNVWHNVARWAIVPVGLFDIGKATLVVWLARYSLEMGVGWAVVAGLCALAGHSFSVFLGFTGGRGIGCILGTLVVVWPLGAVILIVGLVGGYLTKQLWGSSAALLLLPPVSLATGQPADVVWGTVVMVLLTAVKRLEANRSPLPSGPERWAVVGRRLWLDRDTASHEEWVERKLGDMGQ